MTPTAPPAPGGIIVTIPGIGTLTIRQVILDFTGTLAQDGRLLPGVAPRLRRLARRARVTVLTADTCGTARQALARLPVTLRRVATGSDKARYAARQRGKLAAIGNGRNALAVFRQADLRIAVIGPEGCAGSLLKNADVVCGNVRDALDQLLIPLRIKATLRR